MTYLGKPFLTFSTFLLHWPLTVLIMLSPPCLWSLNISVIVCSMLCLSLHQAQFLGNIFSVFIDVILTSFTFKGLHASWLPNLFPDSLTLNHDRKIRLLVVQRIDLTLLALLSLMLLVSYVMKTIWAMEPDRISWISLASSPYDIWQIP